MKKISEQYMKVVEWSEQDQCYVGTAPGLIVGGVHGKNEAEVFEDLCQVVDETVTLLQREGKPLPKATAGKAYSGHLALRIPAELHKALAVRALQVGESLNKLIVRKLQASL